MSRAFCRLDVNIKLISEKNAENMPHTVADITTKIFPEMKFRGRVLTETDELE